MTLRLWTLWRHTNERIGASDDSGLDGAERLAPERTFIDRLIPCNCIPVVMLTGIRRLYPGRGGSISRIESRSATAREQPGTHLSA